MTNRKTKNPCIGSSLDDFVKEEGFFEEASTQAIKEVIAWQLAEEMKEKGITKVRMAEMMKTSRNQLDRVLSPTGWQCDVGNPAACCSGVRAKISSGACVESDEEIAIHSDVAAPVATAHKLVATVD
jgi:antitoxin HicB